MLVLSRKKLESIMVGEIEITVIDVRGDKVRLGIEAPKNIPVDRSEVRDAKQRNPFGQSRSANETRDAQEP